MITEEDAVPALLLAEIRDWDVGRTVSAEDLHKLTPICTFRGTTSEETSDTNKEDGVENTHHGPEDYSNDNCKDEKKKVRKKNLADSDGGIPSSDNEQQVKKKKKKKRTKKKGGSDIVKPSPSKIEGREALLERKKELLRQKRLSARESRENEKDEIELDREVSKSDDFFVQEKKLRYEREKKREQDRDSRFSRTDAEPVNFFEVEVIEKKKKNRDKERSKKRESEKKDMITHDEEDGHEGGSENHKQHSPARKRSSSSNASSSKKFIGNLGKAASKKRPPPLPPSFLNGGSQPAPASPSPASIESSPTGSPSNSEEDLINAAAEPSRRKEKKKRPFYYSLSIRRKHRRSASYPAFPLDELQFMNDHEIVGMGNEHESEILGERGKENGGGSPENESAEDRVRRRDRERENLMSPRRKVVSMDVKDLSPRSQRLMLINSSGGVLAAPATPQDSNAPPQATKGPNPNSAPEAGRRHSAGGSRSRSKTMATLQKFGATIRVTKKGQKVFFFVSSYFYLFVFFVIIRIRRVDKAGRILSARPRRRNDGWWRRWKLCGKWRSPTSILRDYLMYAALFLPPPTSR